MAAIDATPTKRCKRCEETKPLSEFGVNRVNDTRGACDNKNIWCKSCVNKRVAASRQALREYTASRQKQGLAKLPKQIDMNFSPRRIARMLRKLSPKDRVLEAIRGGADTQAEIARVTRLPKDEVGDCIAQALLYEFTIRTEVIDGVRRYFTNDSGQARIQRQPVRPHEPRSYGVSNIYDAGEPEIRGMSTLYLRNKVG